MKKKSLPAADPQSTFVPPGETNFDRYLNRKLQDATFTDRFENAVQAWDIALDVADPSKRAELFEAASAKRLENKKKRPPLDASGA